jgi:hypothetical protein
MYPVSEAFLQAVQENTRKYFWTGRITTKAGVVYEFGAEDIVKGSGYISSQCCGSTEIELGTVYASELGITLLSEVDRYTLEDALVELWYHLQLTDGSYEEVPMGIFEVSEANRTVKCLELKAYDYMLRFEKSFNGFETVGNAYDFMELCSKKCKVELEQSRAVIEAMPNGREGFSIYTENDIETYRDVLFYVGQVLGGFFCINRYGRLELRKYGTDPVMIFSNKHRFSSSFSDFITRYTAVYSTNMKTQMSEYYALDPDDGLTMNLGVNPLLQFGVEETRRQLCTNILNDISVINYVPFDSETIGNPALDLGDVLQFSGGQADDSKLSAITSMQIKIGGKHGLKGVGKNPRLAQAKSKNDKNISGLLNQIEAGKIGIHTFINASSFEIGEQDMKIISIQFATSEDHHAQFFGQVMVKVHADAVERSATAKGSVPVLSVEVTGIETSAGTGESGTETEPVAETAVIGNTREQTLEVELPVTWSEDGHAVAHFTFEFNDEVVEVHQPEETWGSGNHTILLYYPIEDVVANFTNTFNVYMRMTGGTGLVDTGFCVASISGQSMGAEEAWDGTITVEERTGQFQIGGGLGFRGFTESMKTETMELVQRSYADVFVKTGIGGFCRPVDLSGGGEV